MEDNRKNPDNPPRRYPPFYEKAVPFVLWGIVVAVIVLLLVIVGVITGFFD